MSVLVEKIRKSREKVVPVGGFDFTIRRPTDMDMIEYSKARKPADLIKFVIGWGKVTELDLFPGGDGHPAEFDPEACAEWLSDRTDLLFPLITAITTSYQEHKTALEDAQKN